MWINLLIITTISIASSLFFRKEVVECLSFSTFGIIFVLYISGITHSLLPGYYLILIIAALSFIYIIYCFLFKRNGFYNIYWFKLLFFVGTVLLVNTILENSRIICYDEFTAWGLFSKSMFYTNDLYIFNEFPILAKNYQSGTALFQYFITKANGNFSETLLLSSMNILFFSMGFSLLRKLKLKNIFEISLQSLLIFLIPFSVFMWPQVYYTILVDFILGISFGYILYYYFSSKFDKFIFLNISLAIFFLTCSKGNGFVLAILSLFIIYTDILLFNRHKYLAFVLKKKEGNIFSKIKYANLLILVLPIISCLFTILSWFICLRILNIPSFGTRSLLSVIFKPDFWLNFNSYLNVVKILIIEYRYFIISALALGYGILAFTWKNIGKKELIRGITMFVVYLFCNLIYIMFLFIVCGTIQDLSLATQGLRRYLFTLVVANILLTSFFYIHLINRKGFLSGALIVVFILSFTTPVELQIQQFLTGSYTQESVDYRKQYDAINKINKIVNHKNDIIYFVGEQEIDPLVSNYNTFPLSLSYFPAWTDELSYNEYREYFRSKPITTLYPINTELERKSNLLKQNGDMYLYIYKANIDFREKYRELFKTEIQEETLYKIEISEDTIFFVKLI